MWRALAAAAPTAADVRNSRRDRRSSTVELRSAEDGVGLRRRTEPVNLLPSHACPTIPTVSVLEDPPTPRADRKSTRLNSSHGYISYAVFCLKKKKTTT